MTAIVTAPRAGRASLRPRAPRRAVVSTAIGAVAAVALGVLSLSLGRYPITPDRILAVAAGGGTDFESLVLLEWRLPTVVAALVFGASLGQAGWIVQTLTRNPLGSPDIVGIDVGAFTGVAIGMIAFDARGFWEVAVAAVAGGVGTAILITALAYRNGLTAFRLIVVGVAAAAALGSVNAYLVTRANVNDAMAVGLWGAGSLTGVPWESLGPAVAIVVVVLVSALAMTRSLRSLELGDDVATAHGVRVARTRLLLILLAVIATAVVTAVAGPLAFVALAAPHLARRLAAGVGIVGAAAAGALLLVSAQLCALLLTGTGASVPVGLITLCLGGAYLLALLIATLRR